MTQPVLEPQIDLNPTQSERWMVTIFNNDHNTIDDVVQILIRGTGCDMDEALIETWEAHHFGKAPVHFSSQAECELAAKVIGSVGIRTEVSPEWKD